MLHKIRCRDCAYRLGNSNFCLKRQQVISVDRPKGCKDFIPKTKLHFSLEVDEEEKVVRVKRIKEIIEEKPVFVPRQEDTPTIKIQEEHKKEKISWWKRLFRLFRKAEKC